MLDPVTPSPVTAQMGRGEDTMSDIGNIQGPTGPRCVQPVGSPQRQPAPTPPEPAEPEWDTVHISFMAEMLSRIRDLPDIRVEKVAAIQQAIQDGTYDVDGKLDIAIKRMLEDLDLG